MRQPVAHEKQAIAGFSLSAEAVLLYQFLCQARLTGQPGSPTYAEMTAHFRALGRPIGRGTLSDCLDELETLGLTRQHPGQHRSLGISRVVLELLAAPPGVSKAALPPAQVAAAEPAAEPDGLILEVVAQYLKRHQICGIVLFGGRLLHLAEPTWELLPPDQG